MTTATMDMASLREAVGKHLGYTDWAEMTQDRVNEFADATDDHQFIHVDVERAKETPFGGTIAHGYLTLSLMAPIMGQLLNVSDAKMGLNYGLDRVRFPAPLPRSSRSPRWRAAFRSRFAGRSRSRIQRSPPAWRSVWCAFTGRRQRLRGTALQALAQSSVSRNRKPTLLGRSHTLCSPGSTHGARQESRAGRPGSR
jgi:hypothetical protein